MDTKKITEDEVRHVALLARLHVTDDEIKVFTDQLNGILTYMDMLRKVDTTGVEPTSHAVPIPTPFREDEGTPSLSQDQTLSNAPQKEKRFFKVPRIIE